MNLGKWEFKRELQKLCAKCTELKPSTAKKYSNELFDKFSEDGCISHYSEKEYQKQSEQKQNLGKALNTLKEGCITSDSSVLKLEDVSYVDFQENVIEITTKNKQVIRYAKGFEYLKYVFKYQNHYY
jgi:hypothetical protein